jgi:AcrR family transcriptional regulator
MPKIVDHEERRWVIAGTAVKLIAERGLNNTSIREVATACGLNCGIIEHYFASKEDLISTCIDWANEEYEKRTSKAIGTLTGLAALTVRLENVLPLNDQQRMEWKVRMQFWALAAADPTFQDRQSERFKVAQSQFHTDLKQAQKLGELKADISVSDMSAHIIYFTTGISVTAMQSPRGYPAKLIRRALDGLIAELKR